MAKKSTKAPVRVTKGVRKGDTLENFITGMGTLQDKSVYTRWSNISIDRAQLEAAYRNDWIARKIVDIPANDATREWRSWQADKDTITLIEDVENELNIKLKVNNAKKRARLYGGAALVLGVNQGNSPEEPLDISRVGRGDLKFVHVVSKHDLHVEDINRDPMSEFYGQPIRYRINTTNTSLAHQGIHPSRVIRFLGNEMPDPLSLVGTDLGWGDSVLQIVRDAIQTCGVVAQSAAGLLQDGQVDVIKVPEMSDSMLTAGYEERLIKRFANAAMIKSQFGLLLMDKDEEWQRIKTELSGLPDIVRIYLMIAAGAADIPATRMLSQSPAGLSATGESDIRNYYDKVKAEQSNELSPVLEPLDELIIRSALGTDEPDGIFYNWNSLWQMTDEQKAELANKKSAVFTADVNSGLFPDVVMREARINQLIEDGTYPGLEQIIEEAEAAGEFDEGDTPEEPDETLPPSTPGIPGLPAPSPESLEEEQQAERLAQQAQQDARRRSRKGRGFVARPRDILKGRFTPVRGAGKLPQSIRSFFGDAQPRTVYMYRPVVNAADIRAWAKKQGFKTVQQDLHVTLMYSRTPVDWMKLGEDWTSGDDGNLIIKPGGVRLVEKLGGATALLFTSSDLSQRHSSIKYRIDNDWEYPDFQPHITITWEETEGLDLRAMEPYRGKIVLGPEVVKEIDENWAEKVVEDAKWRGDEKR